MNINELFSSYIQKDSPPYKIRDFLFKFHDNIDVFFKFFDLLSQEQKIHLYENKNTCSQLAVLCSKLPTSKFNEYFFTEFSDFITKEDLLKIINTTQQNQNKKLQEFIFEEEKKSILPFEKIFIPILKAYQNNEIKRYNFYIETYKTKIQKLKSYSPTNKIWEQIYECLNNTKNIKELIETSQILHIDNIFELSDKFQNKTFYFSKSEKPYQLINTTNTYFIETVLPMMEKVSSAQTKIAILRNFFHVDTNNYKSIEDFFLRKTSSQFSKYIISSIKDWAKHTNSSATNNNASVEFYLEKFLSRNIVNSSYPGDDFDNWVTTTCQTILTQLNITILSEEIKTPQQTKKIKI